MVEGLGCKAIRVTDPEQMQAAFAQAKELMNKHQVPVVVEVMLERVTNIAMGVEIDSINEFEALAESIADAPTALAHNQ
ncbi:glyoxylate carboligase [Vibrio ponticus]|nr:glyoxylate carboligase [Vibrio ponticus]